MSKASLELQHKIIEVQQYSTEVDSTTFLFDRYTNNNTDLATLRSKIILDTNNVIISGLNDFLVQENLDTKVKIIWTFDSAVTHNEPGEYKFQIVFTNEEDTAKAYTEVGRLKINDSLNVENIIFVENLSFLQQWEEKVELNIQNFSKELTDAINNKEDRIKALENTTSQHSEKITEHSAMTFQNFTEINQIKDDLNKANEDINKANEDVASAFNAMEILDIDIQALDKRIDELEFAASTEGTRIQIVTWEPTD